jgi:hypothetical protein
MLRKLERALENGHTILIENIGESLDAVLNPVIQRAVVRVRVRVRVRVVRSHEDSWRDNTNP